MSKTQRPKKSDWVNNFKTISNREDFINLGTGERQAADQEPLYENESPNTDIIVPKIQIIAQTVRTKHTQGMPDHYIRITSKLNLPRIDDYQLSQSDFQFLAKNQSKFTYDGQTVLTTEFLVNTIKELEMIAGRTNKKLTAEGISKLKTMIQKNYKHILQINKYSLLLTTLLNHWKSQRQRRHGPLIRMFQKPSQTDNDCHLAFRTRPRAKKIRLRSRIKGSYQKTEQHMTKICNWLKEGKLGAERIKERQYQKHNKFALRVEKFNKQVFQITGQQPQFKVGFMNFDFNLSQRKLAKLFSSQKSIFERQLSDQDSFEEDDKLKNKSDHINEQAEENHQDSSIYIYKHKYVKMTRKKIKCPYKPASIYHPSQTAKFLSIPKQEKPYAQSRDLSAKYGKITCQYELLAQKKDNGKQAKVAQWSSFARACGLDDIQKGKRLRNHSLEQSKHNPVNDSVRRQSIINRLFQ